MSFKHCRNVNGKIGKCPRANLRFLRTFNTLLPSVPITMINIFDRLHFYFGTMRVRFAQIIKCPDSKVSKIGPGIKKFS